MLPGNGENPEYRVARCAFSQPDVLADWDAADWRDIPSIALADVVTGRAPDQRTDVRMAWDANALRVIFHATDADPWATLTERDAPLYTEEVVEVFLEPIGDLQSYFEIEVNPLNAVLDLVIRRNRSGLVKNFAWQCEGLRTAVVRGNGWWTAEMAIPFASLVVDAPQPGSRWRANFCRIDRPRGRERELTAWSPTGRPLFHMPERFGTLVFEA